MIASSEGEVVDEIDFGTIAGLADVTGGDDSGVGNADLADENDSKLEPEDVGR